MDKLKPILNQKFWILSTIAILSPLYPWSSGMQSMYKSREGEIKKGPSMPFPRNRNWPTRSGLPRLKSRRRKRPRTLARPRCSCGKIIVG